MNHETLRKVMQDPSFLEEVAAKYQAKKLESIQKAKLTMADPLWLKVVEFFITHPSFHIDSETLLYTASLSELNKRLPGFDQIPGMSVEYLTDVIQAFNEMAGEAVQKYELVSGEQIIVYNNQLKLSTSHGQGIHQVLSAYTSDDVEAYQQDKENALDAIHEIQIDPRWKRVVSYLKSSHETLHHNDLKPIHTPQGEVSTEYQQWMISCCATMILVEPEKYHTTETTLATRYLLPEGLILEVTDMLFSKEYRLTAE